VAVARSLDAVTVLGLRQAGRDMKRMYMSTILSKMVLIIAILSIASSEKALCAQASTRPDMPSKPFSPPARIAGMVLTDTARIDDAVVFTYEGQGISRLDVFMYASPVRTGTSQQQRDAILGEVQAFKRSLPIGVSRGWYDRYKVAFDTERPFTFNGLAIPGFLVATVLARGDQAYVSILSIHDLMGTIVKFRITMPEERWETNPAVNVPMQFLERIAVSQAVTPN
jgi:hypothetical protein